MSFVPTRAACTVGKATAIDPYWWGNGLAWFGPQVKKMPQCKRLARLEKARQTANALSKAGVAASVRIAVPSACSAVPARKLT